MAWVFTGAALITAGILAWMLVQARAHSNAVQQQALQTRQRLQSELDKTILLRDAILKVIDDALLLVDSEDCICLANAAAQHLLGQAIIGQSLYEAVDHPELHLLIQDTQNLRGENVERRIEFQQRILNAQAAVVQDGDDSLTVLLLRDMTEIQRLARARREMVSNVSHELSTPITTIGLLAETLFDSIDRGKGKKARKMADNIRREVDTLTQLVQEMRDLSLIESGQMPVRLTPADLLSIVQASVEPLCALSESKEQTIVLSVPAGIDVLADDVQIQRALKNIVHNAVKFSPEGGEIQITATRQGDEAVIAVKDQGPGIDAKELPRIFERFYQVDPARRDGTGLGLAIVRHIVMAHGGRLWAESVKGHGSTFYIALVLAEDSPEHMEPEPVLHSDNGRAG
ncbi:MAG: PAS domain-containing protein [Anaerolineae bacterium]|jgi:two-component system phosphate regulon sensor histidine kinase PhoR|nr:PAS domain-containing protein [Anaerolineae bacterium]